MPTRFHKMHGAGNDFVLLDLRDQDFDINAGTARTLANRHTGIGCDQVLVLRATPHKDCLVAFEVWNANGSRAEQCGNGVRCIGLYLERRDETPAGVFRIQGPVAKIDLRSEGSGQFRVDMGRPDFKPEHIPLTLEPSGGWYEIDVGGERLKIGAVSMGNPHAVLEVADIDSARVADIGAVISTHPAFPDGCNVGFAQIIDRNHIRLRVYERGAAETMACGSGACAAVTTLIQNEKLDKKVHVNQFGGTLIVDWAEVDGPVLMTGPAVYLFEGMLS